MTITSPLLSVTEVASLLRQSEETVRRKIRDGSLSAVRLGEFGPLRIPAEAIERHLRPVPSIAHAVVVHGSPPRAVSGHDEQVGRATRPTRAAHERSPAFTRATPPLTPPVGSSGGKPSARRGAS